jgi:hypothetical protein
MSLVFAAMKGIIENRRKVILYIHLDSEIRKIFKMTIATRKF